MIKIKLKDGSIIEAESGKTVFEIAKKLSENLARVAVGAKIDEKLVDLTAKISADCNLVVLTLRDEEAQTILRHTACHLMTAAVKNIYPTAKLGVGPSIEGGFYQDFDFATPIKVDDLAKIEAEMDRIIKEAPSVKRIEVSRAEAKRIIEADKDVYKMELLESIPKGEKISFYEIDGHKNLCCGPHLPNLSFIKAFRLTKITGAYWKGIATNRMLTRIYGVAYDKKSSLEDYEKMQDEIKRRDHNKIGRDLGIFTTADLIGQGLPLLMPKGAKMFQILSRFVEDEEERRGYLLTKTTSLAKSDLYKVSSHWDHYKDGMFVLGNEVLDEEVFALRPMTCPFQFMIYKNGLHSYKELPLRYAETSKLFRNENSGEMHGLTRLREFTLSDCHIVARADQVQKVFDEVLSLTNYLMKALGIENDVTYRLSKWDKNDRSKYIDNEKGWESSQNQIREVLQSHKIKFIEAEGEAAFYGPKIDLQARNVYGKEDTIITMQLDFMLADRFDMNYIDENGNRVRPVIIHHSAIGCYERTMATLIEKYEGAFPLWLSATQIVVAGITNKQDEYATKIKEELVRAGFRVETDLRNEKIGLKIREATLDKIPYLVIVGEKEMNEGTISVRTREGEDKGVMSVQEFITLLTNRLESFK